MRRIRLVVFVTVIALTYSSGLAEEKYTCQASVFMMDAYANQPTVASPDGSKRVRLWTTAKEKDPGPEDSKFYASMYSGPKLLKTIELKNLSAATFVKWSPDSLAFYVMWSDGGAIGGYHVRAFLVTDEQATESPAPKNVADDFASHHYCKTRGNNLYAVRWVDGSKRLQLRPEVYPTSDCAPETALSADYFVNTSDGKIIKKTSAKEMTPFVDGCPSNIFPGAFAIQKDLEGTRKPTKP